MLCAASQAACCMSVLYLDQRAHRVRGAWLRLITVACTSSHSTGIAAAHAYTRTHAPHTLLERVIYWCLLHRYHGEHKHLLMPSSAYTPPRTHAHTHTHATHKYRHMLYLMRRQHTLHTLRSRSRSRSRTHTHTQTPDPQREGRHARRRRARGRADRTGRDCNGRARTE